MFYTVYKTTNLANGKFYIGTHKTLDPNDDYLGSGTLIGRAIKKYGSERFKKEVLFVFDNAEAMFAKEAEIVTAEFLAENNTYNLKLGGEGGFDWINDNIPLRLAKNRKARVATDARVFQKYGVTNIGSIPEVVRKRKATGSYRRAGLAGIKATKAKFPEGVFKGRRHSSEAKKAIGEKSSSHQTGAGNSQFGTYWGTNGVEERKFGKSEPLPHAWRRGRKKKLDS